MKIVVHSLPRICMKWALEGFLGWTVLVLSMFPESLSRAKTDESLVPTTKTFLSKPCKLQVSNCIDMMPVQISLSKCFWYNTVGPSISTKATCKGKWWRCTTYKLVLSNIIFQHIREEGIEGKPRLTYPLSDPIAKCREVWLMFRESIEPLTFITLTLWKMWLFPFNIIPGKTECRLLQRLPFLESGISL